MACVTVCPETALVICALREGTGLYKFEQEIRQIRASFLKQYNPSSLNIFNPGNSFRPTNPGSLGSNGSSNFSTRSEKLSIPDDIPPEAIIQEGCLMRKKNAKKGQKMTIKYWKRYWIVLTNASGNGYNDNVLLLYESRNPFIFSRIVDRRQFQRDSAKQMVLSHFVFSEECPNADEFRLVLVDFLNVIAF